jgi:Sulfotransferase family
VSSQPKIPRGPEAMAMPLALSGSTDPIVQQALRSYAGELRAMPRLVAHKSELLRHYDVAGMTRAVAICFWGRSGSHLLASYLDGHDELVLMPENRGEALYEFCQKYPDLTLWERLIVYPTFVASKRWGPGAEFFTGNHAISAAHYYAAVHGLFAAYGDRPAQWLAARQRFLQFVHVGYAVAAGRRPANPRPLIIYAQHWTSEYRAQEFISDFPEGRFLHTIRDPIAALDSWFERQIDMQTARRGGRLDLAASYLHPASETFRSLVRWDQPHEGMAARSRALRFEDLHLAPAQTMQRVAEWLGVPFRPCMLQSTFNGVPFVWKSEGGSWVGANPANAQRRSRNFTRLDRWLMFAVLRDNFLAWGYPLPRPFRHRTLCMVVSGLLLWLPTKMERIAAGIIVRHQALPALRGGRVGFAASAPYFLLRERLRMMRMLAGETRARLVRSKALLRPL